MTNQRRTLAVTLETPGGDNPLLLSLQQPNEIFRGVPVSGLRLVAKGGTPPYAYSILATSSNDLPPGLADPDPLSGEITGTPTDAGHYTFIAQVQDSNSNVFAHSFSIDVLAQLFWIGPPPPPGENSIAYSYRFRVRDGSGVELTSGFTYSGTLPDGLSLASDGTLDGDPTALAVGISYFTVHATDGTDTLNIPIALEVVDIVGGYFLEDRDPPNGWGGGPGTYLPDIIRLQDWSVHLVITGGVSPYTVTLSNADPFPSGIKVERPIQTTISGRTGDIASPYGQVVAVQITDALGASRPVQRVLFVVDSVNARITPQHNGSDVPGGDGFTFLNLVEGSGISITPSNDGQFASFEIAATGVPAGGVQSVNGIGPDSSGNVEIPISSSGISSINGVDGDSGGDLAIDGIVEDSNGDLRVDFPDVGKPVLNATLFRGLGNIQPGDYATVNSAPAVTLGAWRLSAQSTGNIQLDIRVATWPTRPLAGDSIVNGNYLTISGSDHANGTTSGWTTATLTAGQRIEIYVISCSGISSVALEQQPA